MDVNEKKESMNKETKGYCILY